MRKPIALALALAIATTPAMAAPGVTTANVNFRAGPGTDHPSIRVLPAGTAVDVGACDAGAAWCAVTVGGEQGFVSGRYLQESADPDGWPRAFDVGADGRMVLYQPQFTAWDEFRTLKALVAAEYQASAGADTAFGVIAVEADSALDEETGEVVLTDLSVTSLDFSTLDRDALAALAVETGKLLPTGPVTVSRERVAASLAEAERMVDVAGLGTDPPPIHWSTTPAILVQTDGEPAFAPVKGAAGLSFVVNTNWDLLRVDDGGALYLRDDVRWLTASAIDGDWSGTTDLPALLAALPDDGSWDDARAAVPPVPWEGAPPKVIAVDAPSELILFDGEPAVEPVPGMALLWASNTEKDVFRLGEAGDWYVLLSGRWFRAASLDGPWTFATPDLPDDFRNLPEDAPYAAARASVPGTSESAEARLEASIPSTARVEEGTLTPTLAYAGEPAFAPVEGTALSYATNSGDPVILVSGRYYLLQNGVWFVSDAPDGPWTLARAVPEEIYGIPPSSPVYNVTYVRVYETEPDAVWYGYTMGYLYGFLAWGTYVYGTGWRYPPYWYARPGLPPVYYPRPVTYGIGAYYNPVRGTFGRYGYAYGPYRGIAGARAWNPATGTYARAGAAWGPRGEAGFVAATNPRTDTGAFAAGGRNVYGAWGTAGVTRGSQWARVTGRENAAGGGAVRWRTSAGTGGFVREGRRGNVYAGRDGNVYRNTGDGWQRFDGGWHDVSRPAEGDLLRPGDGVGALTPEARARLGETGVGQAVGNLRQEGRLSDLATAGAAGAAGGALAERRGAGAGPRDGAARLADRPASAPAERPSARPAERPAAAQRPAAARPSQAPAHLQRDARTRAVGNQRRMATRQSARPPARASAPRAPGHRSGGFGGRRR